MKRLSNAGSYKALLTLLFVNFMAILAGAQDQQSQSNTITTTHVEKTVWYTEPWAWIVGGIVLVLILIALLSGRNSTVITNTRTVE